MKRKIYFYSIVSLLLLLCLLTGCASSGKNAEINPTLVETVSGPVKGFTENNARVWLGIRFAAPPVGELRWKAPRKPEKWESVFEATQMPDAASHYLGYGDNPGIYGSEDCLKLNVYRPDTEEKDLPVYFWIHGGGNTAGAAREYKGDVAANKLNAVVVITQYRLGWFGFFNHPALRETAVSAEDSSGNFAFLDMIMALEWVRDNISAFGGDPGSVTIAGESAGGYNTMALLGAEPVKEKNLVHRMVSQSSTGAGSVPMATRDQMADNLLAYLAEKDPAASELSTNKEIRDYLYSLDADTLAGIPYFGFPMAVEDGKVFKKSLPQQYADGSYHRVPSIIGGSRDEFKLFACEADPYWGLYKAARGKIPESEIDLTQQQLDAYDIKSNILSMLWRLNGSDNMAAAMAEYQNDIYQYTLNWDGDDQSLYQLVYGAAHAMSIVFFQGDWESGAYVTFGFNEGNLPGRNSLQSAIVSYEKQFMRTGNPGNGWNDSLPVTWKSWSNDDGDVKGISLDATSKEADITMTTRRLLEQEIIESYNAIINPALKEEVRLTALGFFGYSF